MADKKISQLTAASTPLAGSEVLPIVQSSTTVKVAVDDLTVKNIRSNATTGLLQVVGPGAAATRIMTVPDANFTAARTDAAQTFTGDQTLGTGNLVIGTSGKGIDFSITPQPAGMTSELFSDYEEGTWTPSIEGSTTPGTTTYVIQRGSYTKAGRMITCSFTVQWSATTAAGNLKIFGLPFTNTTPNGDGLFFISNGTVTVSNGYVGAVQANGAFIFVYSNVAASDYVSCTFQYFG